MPPRRVGSDDETRLRCGQTWGKLGDVYPAGESRPDLERAAACYERAIDGYSRLTEPERGRIAGLSKRLRECRRRREASG